jgi:cell pole-organizing protein PopZ
VLELSDPVDEQDGLLSQERAAVSRQSLATLAAMRQQGEAAGPVNQGPLEAIVREMLRPMLKQWLDERLPEMVEDMVAREIARITGKGI